MAVIANLDSAKVTYPAPRGAHLTIASFLRPNDGAPYAVGDVISDSTSVARSILFQNVGPSGFITEAILGMGDTKAADLDLLLFELAPPDHLDNAAVACTTADMANCIGVLRFATANKVNIGSNVEIYRAQDPLGSLPLRRMAFASPGGLGGGLLWGLLVTRSVFTPTAQSRFMIRLQIEKD